MSNNNYCEQKFEWSPKQVFYVRNDGDIYAARLKEVRFELNGMCSRCLYVVLELADNDEWHSCPWRNDHGCELYKLPHFYPNKEEALSGGKYYNIATRLWDILHEEIYPNIGNNLTAKNFHRPGYASAWRWDKANLEAICTNVEYEGSIDVLARTIHVDAILYSYNPTKWYLTKEACENDNKPQVFEFDDDNSDEEDFAEQKREEFREYVAHHAPGCEKMIDWEHFYNNKSMPENLSTQIFCWAAN